MAGVQRHRKEAAEEDEAAHDDGEGEAVVDILRVDGEDDDDVVAVYGAEVDNKDDDSTEVGNILHKDP